MTADTDADADGASKTRGAKEVPSAVSASSAVAPPDEVVASPLRMLWVYVIPAASTIGLLVYGMLRQLYAHFYGSLGASPEEVGLGYSETLALSGIAVVWVLVIPPALVLLGLRLLPGPRRDVPAHHWVRLFAPPLGYCRHFRRRADPPRDLTRGYRLRHPGIRQRQARPDSYCRSRMKALQAPALSVLQRRPEQAKHGSIGVVKGACRNDNASRQGQRARSYGIVGNLIGWRAWLSTPVAASLPRAARVTANPSVALRDSHEGLLPPRQLLQLLRVRERSARP